MSLEDRDEDLSPGMRAVQIRTIAFTQQEMDKEEQQKALAERVRYWVKSSRSNDKSHRAPATYQDYLGGIYSDNPMVATAVVLITLLCMLCSYNPVWRHCSGCALHGDSARCIYTPLTYSNLS